MSEKRKPTVVIVASVSGKKARVELFRAALWPKKFPYAGHDRFRVRMSGKWAHGDKSFTISEVLRQLRMWCVGRIKGRVNRKREMNYE